MEVVVVGVLGGFAGVGMDLRCMMLRLLFGFHFWGKWIHEYCNMYNGMSENE